MRQPVLGISASALIIVLSLLVVKLLGVDLFMGWGSYAAMGAIPFAIVVGAFWQGRQPRALADLPQPLRGVSYLVLAAAVAAVVAVVHWVTRGGGSGTPIPMAVMTIITSVVITFFLVIVLGGWPFSLIRNKLAGGVALLVAAYVVNAIVYQVFFDFGFASAAPWYSADLDPGGLFNAWSVVVVIVTGLAVMFAFLMLDVWPLSAIPGLKGSPAFGWVWLAAILVIAWGVFELGTRVAGMEAPVFMVTVPIPFIFGSILLLNMLGGSLNVKLPQPLGGLVTMVLAMVVGTVLALGYKALMPVLSGDLPAGPAGNFQAELWLANALLAITFPLLAFYGDFFGLWPLNRQSAPVGEDAEATA